jgi:hypothetical protein
LVSPFSAWSWRHHAGEAAHHDAAAAGHVEDGVGRPRARGLDEQAERDLVLDGRGRAERNGLAGELVEDRLFVRGGHGGGLPQSVAL